MRLLRLAGENFRSYREFELDLNLDGLIAVVGRNGSGKTSLFTAIEWALYGTRRGRTGSAVRHDSAPDGAQCWVEVDFEVGGRAFRVKRVDGDDAELTNVETGECLGRSLTGATQAVSALLGLTRDVFTGTFYARQSEIHDLEHQPDSARRERVEVLLGIERLRRATGYAREEAKEEERVLSELRRQVPDLDELKSELSEAEQQAKSLQPTLAAARTELEAKTQRYSEAKEVHEQLLEREREHNTRRVAAAEAKAAHERQRVTVEELTRNAASAESAQAEVEELKELASRAEDLARQEADMVRAHDQHQRRLQLRDEERAALSAAAEAADAAAAVAVPPSEHEDLGAAIAAAETRADDLRVTCRTSQKELDQASRHSAALDEQLQRSRKAHALDRQLRDFDEAQERANQARDSVQSLGLELRQLSQGLEHSKEHRERISAGQELASCPTCRRDFGHGELKQALATLEAELAEIETQTTKVEAQRAKRETESEAAQAELKRLQQIQKQRAALGEIGADESPAALDARLSEAREAELELREALEALEKQLGECEAELPRLRDLDRRRNQALARRTELESQRQELERQAEFFASQLAELSVDGYDHDAHERLKAELAEAKIASERRAVLRGRADGLELLHQRLEQEQPKAAAAFERWSELDKNQLAVQIEPEAVETAKDNRATAEENVAAAQRRVDEVKDKCRVEQVAVEAAKNRLSDADRQQSTVKEHSRELQLREAIAAALHAYREQASRRARPSLEEETGRLLAHVTRGRYGAVSLSESYQLQIHDKRGLYPLGRFSGGEQDLAALCLRLALSRTLARQRGADTGFILLDEVFGSQDPDRRVSLLEQLHALTENEFRQIFVISHTPDVIDRCDVDFEVRLENGASVVRPPRR